MLARVAVIGAGVSGLACASSLQAHDVDVVIFEKSGDIGGRMATRRRQGWRWNHGAPRADGLTSEQDGIAESLLAAGTARRSGDSLIGVPDMRELFRPLAVNQRIETHATIERIEQRPAGLSVGSEGTFDRVVLAIPAPQAADILERSSITIPAGLPAVVIEPLWVLLLALNTPTEKLTAFSDQVIADAFVQSTTQPIEGKAWVLHTTDQWSQSNLELSKPEAAEHLLEHLCAQLGSETLDIVQYAAHRWRYARTQQAFGEPYLDCLDRRIALCGDWCLGSTVGDGYRSGRLLAATLVQNI